MAAAMAAAEERPGPKTAPEAMTPNGNPNTIARVIPATANTKVCQVAAKANPRNDGDNSGGNRAEAISPSTAAPPVWKTGPPQPALATLQITAATINSVSRRR